MRIRSTVFWPERDIAANQVVDLDDAIAADRVAQGLAVEAADEEPGTFPAGPAAEPGSSADPVADVAEDAPAAPAAE